MLEIENEGVFEEEYRSEMQEIISAPPPWLIRWGMTFFFLVLLLLVGMCALINYPDVVKAELKIGAENSPKPIFAKKAGRIIRLLKENNAAVRGGDMLAYLESTGDHQKILDLLVRLKQLQKNVHKNEVSGVQSINTPGTFDLGEIQSSYMNFYQSYLNYKAVIANGTFLKRRNYLQRELKAISKQREYLMSQKRLQEKAHELARQEYDMHKTLFEQRVEAKMELKREEAKFLTSQQPLQEAESSLLSNSMAFSAKEKEIMELDNEIGDNKSSFLQALNNLISAIESWKAEYVVSAPQSGRLTYSSFLQENQYVNAAQELYYINPGNSDFFGIVAIPQYSISKVSKGQKVLIRLKSYPYEEYGIVQGKVSSITEVPVRDSVFLSRVDFDIKGSRLRKPIYLRPGMTADAEIITQDASLLRRLFKNVIKVLE